MWDNIVIIFNNLLCSILGGFFGILTAFFVGIPLIYKTSFFNFSKFGDKIDTISKFLIAFFWIYITVASHSLIFKYYWNNINWAYGSFFIMLLTGINSSKEEHEFRFGFMNRLDITVLIIPAVIFLVYYTQWYGPRKNADDFLKQTHENLISRNQFLVKEFRTRVIDFGDLWIYGMPNRYYMDTNIMSSRNFCFGFNYKGNLCRQLTLNELSLGMHNKWRFSPISYLYYLGGDSIHYVYFEPETSLSDIEDLWITRSFKDSKGTDSEILLECEKLRKKWVVEWSKTWTRQHGK